MPGLRKSYAFHNTANTLAPAQLTEKFAYGNAAAIDKWTPPCSDTVYNYLIFYGAHGDSYGASSSSPGAPKKLNELSVAQVQGVIAKLIDKKVSFRYIVLDCCMTASFVPLFIPLLDPETSTAAIVSNLGPGSEMIAKWFEGSTTLGEATARFMHDVAQNMAGIYTEDPANIFCPVTIYRHQNQTMLQGQYADEATAFTNNPSNDADEYPDIPAMRAYLKKQGIKFADVAPAQLQQLIQQNLSVPL